MKVETTVELPEDLLTAIDQRSGEYGGRSELVEAAVRALIEAPSQSDLEARDLAIIERYADELNEEAADALEYQVPL